MQLREFKTSSDKVQGSRDKASVDFIWFIGYGV